MATDIKLKIKADDQTRAAFNSVQKNMKGIAVTMTKVTGIVGGLAGLVGFGALTKAALASGDALAKTSDKIGIASEKLAQLHHITNLYTSAGAGAMDEALTKATKRLGEFNATGGGAASKWLEKLNLDTQALANLTPDQLFNKYSESVRGLSSRGEQLAAVSALMGDESRALIGIIDQSPAALAKAAAESDALGLSLSRIDTAKMEAANDSFTRFAGISAGIGNTLAVQLSPYLEAAANGIVKMAMESGGFGEIASKAIDHVVTAVGYLADTFRGLEIVWVGLEVAIGKLWSFSLKSIKSLSDSVVDFINLIPGINISPLEGLANAVSAIETTSAAAQAELLRLVTMQLPSDNVRALVEEVKVLANEAAIAVAAVAPGGALAGALPEDRLNWLTGITSQQMEDDLQAAIDAEEQLSGFHNKTSTERLALEQNYNDVVSSLRMDAFQQGVQLIQAFAGKSKTAAIAVIALQKGMAIAMAVMNINAAATRAMAELGPIAGPPAVASIEAWGAVKVGLIAATGLAQAANVGGGSGGGAAIGTPGNPVSTTPASGEPSSSANSGTVGTINIVVNGVLTQDIIDNTLVPAIRDGIDNRDVILISNNSRNAQELVSL